jgi:hypothetical protein
MQQLTQTSRRMSLMALRKKMRVKKMRARRK